jgi:hypothetical protein
MLTFAVGDLRQLITLLFAREPLLKLALSSVGTQVATASEDVHELEPNMQTTNVSF